MVARRARAAVALPVATLLLSACADRPPSAEDAARGAGTWTTVPSAPLAPRLGAVTAWTGSEALFLGGDVRDFCPPDAGCARPPESAADGAAYDPAQETWRAVADAPQPIEGGTPRAVAGDTVHVVQDDRLLSYDASEDAWSVSPPAPAGEVVGSPAVLEDGTVVVVDGEREAGEPSGLVYDPVSRTWSELPEDPLGPTFDRVVTAIPGGLVLTARSLPVDPDGSGLEAAVLDLDSDTWGRLGESDRGGGRRWSWTGERMIDVHPDAQRGNGERFAQGGALDPRTGSWAPLEGTPMMHTGGWPVDAVRGPVAAVDGWVYDDRDRSWKRLERPTDAPAEPGSAVWAGDELLVLGGMDTDSGWGAEHLSTDAWVWRPSVVAETAPPSASEGPPSAADLEGYWEFVEGSVGGEPIAVPAGHRATLAFTDGRLTGSSFCNSYGSDYALRGDRLVVEAVGSTLKLCGDTRNAAETAYLDVLGAGDVRVSVRDGRLTLTSGRGALSFSRLPPVPVDELTGRRWVLESIVEDGRTMSPVEQVPELFFEADGHVDVSTACRVGGADWEVRGDTVSMVMAGWYGAPDCEGEPLRQTELVSRVLERVRPTVEGDVLTLVPASAGAPTLVYRAT
jgi:heat shock protein HslJ